MKLKANRLLALASLAFLGIFAMLALPTQAQAATSCFAYSTVGNPWPANGTNTLMCGPAANQLPDINKANVMFPALVNTLPANVKTKLASEDTRFHFFRNRNEAVDYFTNTAPYSNYPTYRQTAGKCGYTAFHASAGIIAVSVYESCSTTTALTQTATTATRTAFHEAGHAFAYSFVSQGQTRPDTTAALSNAHTQDKTNVFSPGLTVWGTYTNAQRDAFVCGLYGTVGNSPFEQELGANSPNPGPVCTGTTRNAPFNGANVTPGAILTTSQYKHLPSYFSGAESEMWAEEFAVTLLGKTSPSNFLPVTDFIYGHANPPTVGGVTPKRAFDCTRFVVETYISTLAPPSSATMTGRGCPAGSY